MDTLNSKNLDPRYAYHPAPTLNDFEIFAKKNSSTTRMVVDENGKISTPRRSFTGYFFNLITGDTTRPEELENERTAIAFNEALAHEFPGLKNDFINKDQPLTPEFVKHALRSAAAITSRESDSLGSVQRANSPSPMSVVDSSSSTTFDKTKKDHSTQENQRLLRNKFKNVASWAASKNTEATIDLENAHAALQWAEKNKPSDVPALKKWIKAATTRKQGIERYASWAEARHKVSLVKEWIEPSVPGASEHIVKDWKANYPNRITSTTSLDKNKEILLFQETKKEITADWTFDEIEKDWESAKAAPWASKDSTFATIKQKAAHYAALQANEDAATQRAAHRAEQDALEIADNANSGGDPYMKERIQHQRRMEKQSDQERYYKGFFNPDR